MSTSSASPHAGWEQLFDELVELPAAPREERLRALAAEDGELAARLSRLLAADAAPAGFLERPATDLVSSDDGEGLLAAGAIVGPWRVIRLLGRGGMGEVYLAERSEPTLAQRVALKIIKRGMDSRAIVRRFLRERQILAALDHPNLARLLDGGTAPDGRPYFALEWVDGEPITVYCERNGIDLDGRVLLMLTVCQAVDSAHRRLVVHRDLKPANILVTAAGMPKLLDFGIAKLLTDDEGDGATQTQAGMGALTPAYAAPEQILGEPVSTATDVYALGVLLYELITGGLPHRREHRSLPALASSLATETVERPSALLRRPGADPRYVRRVAGDLDLIVLTALHADPKRRYPSAEALADDLGRFLLGRPIKARREELGYRVRKFIGRNRLPVAAVTLGVLALFAGLGASLWQGRAARLAAARADAEARRAERVKTFLISIFRQSEPDAGDGPRLTARELLQRGAAQVETGLAGEPQVQADLFDAMARIEGNLSLLDAALAHAEKALAIRRAALPPGDGRIGLSLETLGIVQLARGAPPESRRSYEAALMILLPAFGDDSLEVARARRGLAEALPIPEQSARAVELVRRALATHVRRLGEANVESVETLHQLGGALEQNRQYLEAEVSHRRALTLLQPRLSANPLLATSVQSALAGLLDRLGRTQEARPLFERAIAGQRATLGPRHERLAETLFSYALLLNSAQDYAGAEAALEEALAIFGPDRFESGHCLRYLGIVAMRRDRFAAAADLFTRAMATYRRTAGENDVQRWRTLANLGSAHFRLGQVQQALGELTTAVARIAALAGAESSEIAQPLQMLGDVQTAAGAPGEAVATLRRVRSLVEKLYGTAEHREVATADLRLARALLARRGSGDALAARRALDEGLGIFARSQPDSVIAAQALLESGRLALDSGDRPRARRDLAAAETRLAALKGVAHRDTREAHRLLAAAADGGS